MGREQTRDSPPGVDSTHSGAARQAPLVRATAASLTCGWMGGVCAGLAVHLGCRSCSCHIIMICMTFVGFQLRHVYLWLWVTVEGIPPDGGADTAQPRPRPTARGRAAVSLQPLARRRRGP